MENKLLTPMPLSPFTKTVGATGVSATQITVEDIAAFPVPNVGEEGVAILCAIKDFYSNNPNDFETITYTGITGSTLTGVTRAVEGTAKSWVAGTTIACMFVAEYIKRINAELNSQDAELQKAKLALAKRLCDLEGQAQVLAGMNPNAEELVTATSIEPIVHLPKNAASGRASVGMQGETRTNLVRGGNDDLDAWEGTYKATESGWYKAVAGLSSVSSFGQREIPVVGGEVYTLSVLGKSTGTTGNNSISIRLYNNDGSTGELFSVIFTNITEPTLKSINIPTPSSTAHLAIFPYTTGSDGILHFRDVLLEKGTGVKSYISGNAPKSTAGAVRVRSVGKNLVAGDYKAAFTTSWVTRWDETLYQVDPLKPIYINWSVLGSHRAAIRLLDINMNPIKTESPSMFIAGLDGIEGVGFNASQGSGAYITVRNKELVNDVVIGIQPSRGVCFVQIGLSSGNVTTARTVHQTRRMISQETMAYEPYTGNALHLNAGQPLRSLPNGVKDEIRSDGKGGYELVQRVSISELGEPLELAEPLITPIQSIGQLHSYPSGTLYYDPILADVDFYGQGITIEGAEFSGIERVTKVDLASGKETDITTTCTPNAEHNGFTSTALLPSDICWYELRIAPETTTQGELSYSYYDSRYAVVDDTNGKVYGWKVKSTNGTPRIELEEI